MNNYKDYILSVYKNNITIPKKQSDFDTTTPYLVTDDGKYFCLLCGKEIKPTLTKEGKLCVKCNDHNFSSFIKKLKEKEYIEKSLDDYMNNTLYKNGLNIYLINELDKAEKSKKDIEEYSTVIKSLLDKGE